MIQPQIFVPGLGIYQIDDNAIVSPRLRLPFQTGPIVVPPSSFAAGDATVILPTLSIGDAVLSEYLSAFIVTDTTGNLELTQLDLTLIDSTTPTPQILLDIAQPLQTITIPFARTGLLPTPPPVLTFSDLNALAGAALVQPVRLRLEIGMLNLDAAIAHSFVFGLKFLGRIISGVREA